MKLNKEQTNLILKLTELKKRVKEIGEYESLLTALDIYRAYGHDKALLYSRSNDQTLPELYNVGEELINSLNEFDNVKNIINPLLTDNIMKGKYN